VRALTTGHAHGSRAPLCTVTVRRARASLVFHSMVSLSHY